MNPVKKALVAYFSHSGNTREIARQIQEATGADVFDIVPVDPYPTDYDAVVGQAKQELRTEYRPLLKSNGPDLKAFDVIYCYATGRFGSRTIEAASYSDVAVRYLSPTTTQIFALKNLTVAA